MEIIEFSAHMTTVLIVTGKVLLALFGICMILALIMAIIFEIAIVREEIKEKKDKKNE